jgi:hypothetical protein
LNGNLTRDGLEGKVSRRTRSGQFGDISSHPLKDMAIGQRIQEESDDDQYREKTELKRSSPTLQMRDLAEHSSSD